jgi:four helix bundle protein
LAEGCGRDSDKELARFVDISMGSSFELRCQLLIARDLGYIESSQYQLFESKILEINRMLRGFLKKLRA